MNPERIDAALKDGILTVRFERPGGQKPQKIAVIAGCGGTGDQPFGRWAGVASYGLRSSTARFNAWTMRWFSVMIFPFRNSSATRSSTGILNT